MTAEVVALNKQCVALAADSAVTISQGAGSNIKVFNTTNKLFALSRFRPVGIMVYSSAEIMGVPVETVIKEFRHRQQDKKYAHLEEYKKEFESFLATDDIIFSVDARNATLARIADSVVHEIYDNICERVNQLPSKGQSFNQTIKKALLESVSIADQGLSRLPAALGVDDNSSNRSLVSKVVGNTIDNAIQNMESMLPIAVPRKIKQQIRALIVEHFFRDVSTRGDTGFVIAGFGEDNPFPCLRAFEFCCSIPALHKVRNRIDCDISSAGTTARIVPFAQKDTMHTFLGGIHPHYEGFISSFLESFLQEEQHALLSTTPQKNNEATLIKDIGSRLQSKFKGEVNKFKKNRFIDPLMDIVESMPKEELAVVVEALVNLTSLKQKASLGSETVGGPTDVAVISKGDGFIWIKRKHYFDPLYNPGFMATYREANCEN